MCARARVRMCVRVCVCMCTDTLAEDDSAGNGADSRDPDSVTSQIDLAQPSPEA